MPDAETEARLKVIEAAIARLAKKVAELAAGGGDDGQVVNTLRQRVASITTERDTLAASVATLRAARPKPTPEQVGQSFAGAAQTLRNGLGQTFAVADMAVEMKTQFAVESDGALRLVLPQPGETFAADTLSTLRFSLRPALPAPAVPDASLIPVPTLVGLPREAALLLLARAGLKPGAIAEHRAPARPGTVIGQDPPAGDEIAAEIAVALTVAVPFPVTVPDVGGLAAEAARAVLLDAGVAVGAIADAPAGTTGTPGTVAGQSAKAGTQVAPGTAIELRLVPAPPPAPAIVRVPDVVGRPVAEAASLLAPAKLVPGAQRRLASSQADGTVLATSPAAGAELPEGGAVGLTVARKADIAPLLKRIRVRGTVPTPVRPGVAQAPNRIVEQIRAQGIATPEALAALLEEPDAALATKLALPTPREAAAARALIRSVLEE
jgi:beta-lactam-binding protein with PASTA domain